MKYILKIFFLLGIIDMLSLSAIAKDITCTIKGKIVGRDSKNILLHKGTTDIRGNRVEIPIVNNTFNYTFTVPASEVYMLVFEDELESGGWRPIQFFPEKGIVHFTLYPTIEGDKNKVEGGQLNKQLQEYINASISY